MQTILTDQETDALIERIARWTVSLGIGDLTAFLVEVHRPIARLTGNLCIAGGSFAEGLGSFSVHSLGLLMQDDAALVRLRDRIRELTGEASLVHQDREI